MSNDPNAHSRAIEAAHKVMVGFGPPKRGIAITEDTLKEMSQHSQAWESNAKRLALELECLIMSCDLPAASKWWASAHEAMELHRQLIADIYKDAEGKS